MSFARMILDLGDGFKIVANETDQHIAVQVHHQDQIIGSARIITDRVDVEFMTQLMLAEEWAEHVFPNGKTLSATFVKFLIKYPNLVRKPEFRFMASVPASLKHVVATYHFEENLAPDIMVRSERRLPDSRQDVSGFTFSQTVSDTDWPMLLDLLQTSAYWQTKLDMERLHLLVKSSVCMVAKDQNRVVGFARVVTDHSEIASLWDVVVIASHQGRGIATQMMYLLLTDATLEQVPQWLLYSDTPAARHIYDKFGFRAAQDLPQTNFAQKLRLQENPPNYLLPLMDEIQVRSKANTLQDGVLTLSAQQTQAFLFETKRADLAQFWRQQIAFIDDRTYQRSETQFWFILFFSMLLVDTYAFRNIAYPFFSGQVDHSIEHQAADDWIPVIVNVIVIGLSLLFSINMSGAQLVGELNQLVKHSAAWEAKRLEIIDLFRNGLIISAAVGPLCMLPMIYSEPLLVDGMQQNPAVAKDASTFLIPDSAIVVPVFLWMNACQIINAFQYTRLIISGPINFGIAVFLVEGLSLGKFGMPREGQDGIVEGYVTEAWLTTFVYWFALMRLQPFRDLQFWRLWYVSPQFYTRLMKQVNSSAAITATIAAEMGLLWYLSAQAGGLGVEEQAAFALALESLLINVLLMIAGAVSGAIIVGGLKGSQRHQDVYRNSQHAVWMTAIVCAFIPIFFAAYPEVLAALFQNNNPQVMALLGQVMVWIALGQIGDGAAYAQMLQLRAFQDAWIATLIRIACILTGAAVSTVLVYKTDKGIESLGIGYFVAEWLSCLALSIRMHAIFQAYRREYNVQASPACLTNPRQAAWGFLGRGRQRYLPAALVDAPAVDIETGVIGLLL